jgi:hypothetical protein
VCDREGGQGGGPGDRGGGIKKVQRPKLTSLRSFTRISASENECTMMIQLPCLINCNLPTGLEYLKGRTKSE